MIAAFEIVKTETGEVVHVVPVSGKSERQIERIENGLINRTDLDCYHIREAHVDRR